MTNEQKDYIENMPGKIVDQYKHDVEVAGLSADRAKQLTSERIQVYGRNVARIALEEAKK
jgi:hypothetical protein